MVAVAGKVQPDQEAAAGEKERRADQGQGGTDQELEAEGIAHALIIAGAVELGGENARAGAGTKDTQVEHEDQTVDDGNAAHGYGADLAHHDVVEHGYEIGDAVLDDDGDGNPKTAAVERPVANVTI